MIISVSEWVYNDRPDGVRFLPDRVGEPGRGQLEDEIWSWIVRGEQDAGEFVDYLDDDEERHGLTEEELEAAYETALEARRTQQRAFGPVRSNLTRAFDELNEAGVLARENFTCCGTCAGAEIHDERDDSRHWHGYVWYHQQDTESLVDSSGGSVYLGYGAYPPADFDTAAFDALSEEERQAWYQTEVEHLIDDLVVPALQRNGMQVHWNRNLATRVLVTGARWYAPLE